MKSPLLLLLCASLSLLAPAVASAHEDDDPHAHVVGKAKAPTKKPLDALQEYLLKRPEGGGPSRLERLGVAAMASGAAVGGITLGVLVGFLGVVDPVCVDDVATCRPQAPDSRRLSPETQVNGRIHGDRRLMVADMGFMVAAAFSLLALAGVVLAVLPDAWWQALNNR